MDPVQALTELGGIAALSDLRTVTTRATLARAIASGAVVRLPRHLVALPGVQDARRAAASTGGVVSHLSAAQHWEWKVKLPPARPTVTVPRGRRVDRYAGRLSLSVEVHRADLATDDVVGGVTSPVRTVVDCARSLPFDAALAVADSALRSGLVEPAAIVRAAERSPRTGRARALRVSRAASGLADNPFESCLRAIALDVPGLRVRPQGWVGRVGRVDLVDDALMIAIEAESWSHHGDPSAFRSDVRRYTDFACLGWVVVRFLWEQVMHRPTQVQTALAQVAAVRARQLGAGIDDSWPARRQD